MEHLKVKGLRPVAVTKWRRLGLASRLILGLGPSGLRPQHLGDSFVPGLRDEVLSSPFRCCLDLVSGCGVFLRPAMAGKCALPKNIWDMRS